MIYTQAPSYIIASYLAGDYFQALRNIIVPAAPMVWQQKSLIITNESLDIFLIMLFVFDEHSKKQFL